jgi:hypothetical protein
LTPRYSTLKRATIYLEEDLHRALKLKSVEADKSISHLVNDAIRITLSEDLEDLSDVENRTKEKTVSYEDFLKELRSRGQI